MNYQITSYVHHFLTEHIAEGDFCIDATAGNGNDTEFLCRSVGESGHVLAFDIQESAIDSTKQRLINNGLNDRAELILDGHEHLRNYAEPDSAAAIVFNFGYLPGGDHALATKADTSITAIESALEILKKNGILSLCIYSGGDSGFEERDALLSYLKTLDSKKYLVLLSSYYNRPNNPPIPVFVIKLH